MADRYWLHVNPDGNVVVGWRGEGDGPVCDWYEVHSIWLWPVRHIGVFEAQMPRVAKRLEMEEVITDSIARRLPAGCDVRIVYVWVVDERKIYVVVAPSMWEALG